MINFRVPLIPPSVNHIWKRKRGGGAYLSAEAKAFTEAVQLLAPRTGFGKQFCEVQVTFYLPANKMLRNDLDNLLKGSIDSLTKAGILADDRYVSRIVAVKVPAHCREAEGTEFSVFTL
jgi:crossover junction endodeoxyribonuclease RusA